MWEGAFEGEREVYDWNSKTSLINDAIENGWDYKIIRTKRKTGEQIVVEYYKH